MAEALQKRVEEILANLDFAAWDSVPGELEQYLMVTAKDGAREAFLQLDVKADTSIVEQANEKAAEYARQRSAELVGKRRTEDGFVDNPNAEWRIDEATREMLRDDVTTALEEGWSNDRLADELKTNYGFSDTRAEVIARTETARADVAGNVAGWESSGVVAGRQWLAAPDCCDLCQELDGEETTLNQPYTDGVDGVPLHPQCRCNELPILIGEAENDQ